MSVRQLAKVTMNVLRINFEKYMVCMSSSILRPKTQSSNPAFVFQVYVGMCGSRSHSDEQKLICWLESVATQHCSQKGSVCLKWETV